MQVSPHTLPNTVAELQQLLIEKLSIIEQHEKTIASSQSLNKVLEEKLRLLNQKLFAKSSEKNPGQAELQFLNEAEMLHSQEAQDELESDEEEPEVDVPAHTRKPVKYDIALADETGIQVLKEHGRKPENKSYLWIGGGA